MAIDHNPKVFISYSWKTLRWTTEEYKKKVRELATRLRRNGVDVILDQWDLRPGYDMNAFMEQSISVAERVLILCERGYAEKANARTGGVGKETYIISEEVYNEYKQEKFIPVVMEEPSALPSYLRSRYAVFFTNDDEDEYKDLLRTIFDIAEKPPELGPLPSEDWVRGVSNHGGEEQKNAKTAKGTKMSRKPDLGEIPEWVKDETEAQAEYTGGGDNCGRSTASDKKTFDAGLGADSTVSDVTGAMRQIVTKLYKGDKEYRFGSYSQDKNGKREPLLWRVLDIDEKNNRALLITEKLVDCHQYHTEFKDITWEECDLRRWLNHEFIDQAFTDSERTKIAEVEIRNPDNDTYGTKGGNATRDRVFALSVDEAEKFFKDDVERRAAVTPYANSHGSYANSEYHLPGGGPTGRWWLRSPGYGGDYASRVHTDGEVGRYGLRVGYVDVSVRPALWLNL